MPISGRGATRVLATIGAGYWGSYLPERGRCRLHLFITVWKCAHRADYWQAQCRDARRELTPGPGADSFDVLTQVLAVEPTAEETTILNETVELLLRDLEPDERAIVEQILQGDTVSEIAAALGCAQTLVKRVRRYARHRLQRILKAGSHEP